MYDCTYVYIYRYGHRYNCGNTRASLLTRSSIHAALLPRSILLIPIANGALQYPCRDSRQNVCAVSLLSVLAQRCA